MFRFPPSRISSVLGESIESVCAGDGPSVVLVNGSGGPIEGWHRVFEPLAAQARVFAYHRPGLGKSSQPSVPQVGSHLVASLRATLAATDVPPPYVLVGHSLGGLIVNSFARHHPSEVRAVVLLEATSPDDPEVLARYENWFQRASGRFLEWVAPSNPHAEHLHLATTVAELRSAPPFPPLPLVVVTGGKPAMAWATNPEALAARAAHQRALVELSPLGRQIVAPGSGHFPQLSESEIVVRAILDAARETLA